MKALWQVQTLNVDSVLYRGEGGEGTGKNLVKVNKFYFWTFNCDLLTYKTVFCTTFHYFNLHNTRNYYIGKEGSNVLRRCITKSLSLPCTSKILYETLVDKNKL